MHFEEQKSKKAKSLKAEYANLLPVALCQSGILEIT